MGLRDKYKVSMAVTRLVTVGYKNEYETLGTVTGHMQPLDPAYSAPIEGNLSKSFTVWVAVNADIDIGDKLTIATGDYAGTYYMKEVKKYGIGKQKHKEIIIEEKDA